jgi:flagellar protein FlbD
MIPLTRLNGDQVLINPDRIERADITPDVVLTLTDGSKCVITESLDEVIDRIRLFRASVLALSHRLDFEGDLPDLFVDLEGEDHLRIVRDTPNGRVVERDAVPGDPRASHPVNLHAVADGDAGPDPAERS